MPTALRPGARQASLNTVVWCWRALLGMLLFLTASGAARAQLVPNLEGIPAGRFVFYPSVAVDYTHDSNVLYLPSNGSSGDIVGAWVTVVRPRFVVDLPI